jgi:hypothetical protein
VLVRINAALPHCGQHSCPGQARLHASHGTS